MNKVYEMAVDDIHALQEGGIDALQFSNEFSFSLSAESVERDRFRDGIPDRKTSSRRDESALRCKCGLAVRQTVSHSALPQGRSGREAHFPVFIRAISVW